MAADFDFMQKGNEFSLDQEAIGAFETSLLQLGKEEIQRKIRHEIDPEPRQEPDETPGPLEREIRKPNPNPGGEGPPEEIVQPVRGALKREVQDLLSEVAKELSLSFDKVLYTLLRLYLR